MKNLVIGITGGIGAGKSTVSSLFKENGYPLLLADDIAKTLMDSDKNIIKKIKSEFGDEVYKDGKLNKKLFAEKVFDGEKEIKKINSIIHPPTINYIESKIKELSASNEIIFVESALIFEAEMEYMFDYILLVTADEDLRISRLVEKGNESESKIRKRMKHQLSDERKKQLSDFVIENNSTVDDLKAKSLFFLNLFKTLT